MSVGGDSFSIDFSPLITADCVVISREIESELIKNKFTRSLTVDNSEDLTNDVVATFDISDINISFTSIVLIIKATGYSRYSLIREEKSNSVFTEYIILRK